METNEKKAYLTELQNTPEIYVIMSICTKMPYVYCEPETYDDQVFLFHKEEDAKKTVEDFRAKEIPVVSVKLENKQFLSFYSNLYMLGINGLSVDYGTEQAEAIQLSELVRRPDYSKLPEGKVKVENPELQLTSLYYMQEIRRKPGEKPKANLREMEEEMMAHLKKGTYIVPVAMQQIKQENEEEPKTVPAIPTLKMKNGDIYQPVFTDMPEFLKFTRGAKFRPAVLPFAKLPTVLMAQSKGWVVNPMGFNLFLNKNEVEKPKQDATPQN